MVPMDRLPERVAGGRVRGGEAQAPAEAGIE
jgi:hypothetical protein